MCDDDVVNNFEDKVFQVCMIIAYHKTEKNEWNETNPKFCFSSSFCVIFTQRSKILQN